MEQRIMRLLVLGNLILHHFAVIHPQPEMQGLGRHYQGIRMCVESCLLTGHCQGVRYDVSSLMCSLQLDEGGTVVTFAQEAETLNVSQQQCGELWCHRGEVCISNRRSKQTCVSYLTWLKGTRVPKYDLERKLRGSVPINDRNYVGMFASIAHRNRLFLLDSQKKISAIDNGNASVRGTVEITHGRKFEMTGYACGKCWDHYGDCMFIMATFTESWKGGDVWLFSFDETIIDFHDSTLSLEKSIPRRLQAKARNHHILFFRKSFCLHASSHGGRPGQLDISIVLCGHKSIALQSLASLETGYENISTGNFKVFCSQNYLFLLVQNVISRWPLVVLGHNVVVNSTSRETFQTDSLGNSTNVAAGWKEKLYQVDWDGKLYEIRLLDLEF